MRHLRMIVALATALGVSGPGYATDFLEVPNASNIAYVVSDTHVWLRNLGSFDPTWLGCCYNYSIDITTDAGKAMFSAFLTAYGTGRRLVIGVPSKSAAGPVVLIGPA